MQIAEIEAWAKAKMGEIAEGALETGYRWHHGRRVAELALELAEQEGLVVDRELLYVGALLHDVGKENSQGEKHGPRGARLITEEIPQLFTGEELQRVAEIVANHYQRPKSKYLRGKPDPGWPKEVLLVQDADTLDHFGANGIWISWHWAALEKSSPADVISRHHTVDAEWRQESLAAMNYEASVRELERRIAFMHRFIEEWSREEQGLLCSVKENA